jgi:hypothetical protein
MDRVKPRLTACLKESPEVTKATDEMASVCSILHSASNAGVAR